MGALGAVGVALCCIMSNAKLAFVAVAIGVAVLTTAEYLASQTAPDRAAELARPAAASLGVDLSAFSGPVATGSHFAGTQSFHWERESGVNTTERLSLLVSEDRLCWSSEVGGNHRDHGCIVATGR